jgi:hypothetical protein
VGEQRGCRIEVIAINKRMFASDAMSVSLVMGHDGEGDAFAGRMQTKEKGGRRGIRSPSTCTTTTEKCYCTSDLPAPKPELRTETHTVIHTDCLTGLSLHLSGSVTAHSPSPFACDHFCPAGVTTESACRKQRREREGAEEQRGRRGLLQLDSHSSLLIVAAAKSQQQHLLRSPSSSRSEASVRQEEERIRRVASCVTEVNTHSQTSPPLISSYHLLLNFPSA